MHIESNGKAILNNEEPLAQKTAGEMTSSQRVAPGKKLIEHSEAMQEIVSRKSGFVERWALFLFMGVLGSILFVSWVVKYPDVIVTEGSLSSSNFPKAVIVQGEGRLKALFAVNGGLVKKDQVIGWMESTASYHAVDKVGSQIALCIAFLKKSRMQEAVQCFDQRVDSLGELQREYQTFIAALQLYSNYTTGGYFIRRRKMLGTDLQQIEEEHANILEEKKLSEQDLKIAAATFEMNRQLFEQRSAPEDEYRQAQSAFIGKQMAMQRYSSTILANQVRMNDKLKEIEQLDYEIAQQQTIFEQSLQTFSSAVEEWRKKNLLTTPIDGTITFVSSVQENQHLPKGKVIGFVNPDGDRELYIETNLRQASFGKIDTGMKALLRFDAYPYQEFGQVTGTVAYISGIPSDSGFLANIRLDRGLLTSAGKSIPYKDRLKLEVRIITKDMRLLERFYHNLTGPEH